MPVCNVQRDNGKFYFPIFPHKPIRTRAKNFALGIIKTAPYFPSSAHRFPGFFRQKTLTFIEKRTVPKEAFLYRHAAKLHKMGTQINFIFTLAQRSQIGVDCHIVLLLTAKTASRSPIRKSGGSSNIRNRIFDFV